MISSTRSFLLLFSSPCLWPLLLVTLEEHFLVSQMMRMMNERDS
ncbi:hypothetical protein F8388_000369 [Cannabis sativa]|uniref:Uncharacterized protein n=1 Tax=Cannabis sativa TaxID=3483 RepID=A0A7J6FN66_CANSA|nr:hypothetical protein F8388_000369 [Cannabis sativa]